MTDDERRMLAGAQKAAIDFGNENSRLRAENAEMREMIAAGRSGIEERYYGRCPYCMRRVGRGWEHERQPHKADCPFVRFGSEDAND